MQRFIPLFGQIGSLHQLSKRHAQPEIDQRRANESVQRRNPGRVKVGAQEGTKARDRRKKRLKAKAKLAKKATA